MKKTFSLFLIALLTILATACGSNSDTAAKDKEDANATPKELPSDLAFGASSQGGLWYPLAGAMGNEISNNNPDTSVTVIEGGTIANLLGISQDQIDIGFSNGQVIPSAIEGKGEFKKPAKNLKTLATLYPNVMHIVVRADSDIHSIEDLKGKKVSPGLKGYSGELAFKKILEVNDMSYDDLGAVEYVGTADAVNLIRDGNLDSYVGLLTAPVSSFQELDTTVGIRLIPLDQSTIDKMHEANPAYLEYTVKKGTYPNSKNDVKTVSTFTVMVANSNTISEESAYKLTKMVVENKEKWTNLSKTLSDFNAKFSVENNIGELHPGAKRYYKEIGALE
ncbi:TAXI family TRAP transporter solute-binding subunit [Halobacillus mangrovi]|uniref:C4-dicarboxylate ABC transporter substrate-binding protein n=1 Tax=Halobacillus mangrovi TaxID=402384 RepID=A0A1W5ZU96_9BACI|nr:TAXI family TRAP transporter solute-binding subunit [Halobacillus mangrovi]ARI76884.1 hypothetical protein HM131_08535 [Halobacillus mangrovi]